MVDSLTYFFIQSLKEIGLLDVEPIKLRPTWSNKQVSVDRIAKRLDVFLIFEGLPNDHLRIRQWVGLGGD